MYKFTLNLLTLSLGLSMLSMAEAAPTAHQLLMAQVRLGEDTHREDLVEQSLYRLELVEPNNPDVVAARFRYLLRRGNIDGAQNNLPGFSCSHRIQKYIKHRTRLCDFPRLMAVRHCKWHVYKLSPGVTKRLLPITTGYLMGHRQMSKWRWSTGVQWRK